MIADRAEIVKRFSIPLPHTNIMRASYIAKIAENP